MSADMELEVAEAEALAATLETAKALCSLLELVRPIAERRAREDVRFDALREQVHLAQMLARGTPVAIREALAELGGMQ